MIASRKIDDLHPHVAELCHRFIDACAAQGIDILITSTYRDAESQAALYAQGRSTPGPIVTFAKPGHSYHNYRLAFDFAPMTAGKIDWNDRPTFARCGALGEALGLEWAGRWKTFAEMPHLQWTGGLSIEDLLAGKEPQC